MEALTHQCPTCNKVLGPFKSQAVLHRVIGNHNSRDHGIEAPTSAKNKRYTDKLKAAVTNGLQSSSEPVQPDPKLRSIMRKRLYQKLYRESHRNAKASAPDMVKAMATQAEPCKLSECPNCGSRFYVAKGPQ
jgi:hypothetical protein